MLLDYLRIVLMIVIFRDTQEHLVREDHLDHQESL